ncbi:MAG: mobile mystery protein A [Thiothrix sp.]
MKQVFRELKLQQTSTALEKWRNAGLPSRPGNGWIRSIREALGMTSVALAKRLGMTDAGIRNLEKAEADDAITLASLRKLAEALDCELKYALIPRQSLEDMLQQRAEQLARERVLPVAHSMVLEDQAVYQAFTDKQIKQLAKELLEGSRRELWK